MAKLTLTDLASLTNETGAVNAINNNSALIETAMENTLSLDGTTPNSMGADLDMDSNQILNLPEPVNDHEPATKGYVDALVTSTALGNLGLSSNGVSLVQAADYAAMRGLLDLEAGTDFYDIAAADAAIAAAVADYTTTADLASTASSKGASLIGIEDSGGLITATTVEAALAENRSAIDTIEADYLPSVNTYGANGDGVTDNATAFTNAASAYAGSIVYVPAGEYYFSSSPTVNTCGWLISPEAVFTGAGRPTFERGFWTDQTGGANIWRFRDRVFIGDAATQDGSKTAATLTTNGATTWVTSTSYMAYFDTRSQLAAYSTIGKIGGAFATRTSDDAETSERGAIGVGSFCLNDLNSGSEKKSIWNFYGHGIHMNTNNYFSTCQEMAMINLSGTTVTNNPYSANPTNSCGILTLDAGGETGQYIKDNTTFTANSQSKTDSDVKPLSYGILFLSNAGVSAAEESSYPGLYQRNRLDKGIIFSSRSLYRAGQSDGTTAETAAATAIEMAQGHQIRWKYSAGTNANGGVIRSDCASAANQSRLIFASASFDVKGVQSDYTTENTLFRVYAPTITSTNATNYVALTPSQTSGGLTTIGAEGVDTNIDIRFLPKGSGVVRFGYATAAASVPANFAANRYLAIKDSSGTTYYVPCMGSTW